METEAYYPTNPLAIFTEADSQFCKDLILKMAEDHYDFLLNTSESTADEITRHLLGFDVEIYSSNADLSSFKGVEEFYREIISLGRPVDTLVVSPRFLSGNEVFLTTTFSEQFNIIRSNTLAPVHLIGKILNEMQERNEGKIIFPLAESGHKYPFHQTIVDASKAFLKSYGESLKQDLKETGITVIVFTNESVKKKIQDLASRYLPEWAKKEMSIH